MTVQAVKGFGLDPAAAAAHIAALGQLSSCHPKPAQVHHTAADWGGAVLKAAEEVLAGFVEQARL